MKSRVLVFAFALVTAHVAMCRPPVGTNLAGLNDWSSEFTFVDAFKTSRPWISGTRVQWADNPQRPINVDEHGWVRSLLPGQVVRTLMFWGTGLRYPEGQYVVEYDGSGTIEYAGGAIRISSSSGRDVLQVNPSFGGIALSITSTNPSDYVRNIHVWMPDTAHGDVFYPLLLDRIRNYKVLRFVHWMLGQGINDFAQPQPWAERPTLSDARWNVKGAPLEIMTALANRVGASPWFTIPHLVDEDYIRHFAEVVSQTLDPSLKVYVEDSDEVWNGHYVAAVHAREQGLILGLSTNPFEAQIRYHALRSTQIFSIFEQVFPKDRLVRVLGSFADMPWVSTTALSFRDTLSHTDALAIAPYFGLQPQELGTAINMSLDQFMPMLANTLMPRALDNTRRQAQVATHYGVPLIAYEGGQSLVTVGSPLMQNASLNALFDAANRDPRMGAIYTQYLNGWVDAGGQLFVHYTNCGRYGVFGRFGSLETLDQPREHAPKYDALQRFIEGSY